nr:ATP-binding protein [uncultured Acetatifactor sp.]
MVLSLKNIGKLVETQIAIDGITVIAGENDTGKSTVGKALFAVFNSFYDVDRQVLSERIDSIESVLSLVLKNANRTPVRYYIRILAEDIASHQVSLSQKSGFKDRISESVLQMVEKSGEGTDDFRLIEVNDSDEVVHRIQEIMDVSEEEILKAIVEKFNGQVTNLFTNKKGEIRLQIKDKSIALSIENNRVTGIENAINLHVEAVYMDDPFLLDTIPSPYFGIRSRYADHRTHLRKKIFDNASKKTAVEEIIVNNKFQNIYEKISSVCSGEIVRSNQKEYSYKSADSDKLLDVRNLSTGLKTFVILKTLLLNGGIEYNGVVILDEPEIHLHPEWQLLFAELIVLLHKEFDVHILLNTHSPYFLRAIQVYSAKYEMADKCRYYLSENSGNQAAITDVSDDIERIYARLSKPLQDLEDERWRDDSLA